MDKWEYLRVSVSHRGDDRLDFIAKKDKALPSIATHDGMEGHFNVTRSEWESFRDKLFQDGWELESVESREHGRIESYAFKRPKT